MTETVGQSKAVGLGRALASPIGVLVTVPLLVVAVGVGILLVGRDATRSTSRSMARHQLAEQARSVQTDVAFALDQAGPLLDRMRTLADPARPLDDVLPRLHDLLVGRPGVGYLSISFPDGMFRGAYLTPAKTIEVQESRVDNHEVKKFAVDGKTMRLVVQERNEYDPRMRDFYTRAQQVRARLWTEPYTFFKSHETGITCAEPIFEGDTLRAVLTVDFQVNSLSSYVVRPALDRARSLVYTRDGTILAYPAADKLALPANDKLLRREDVKDAAVDALVAANITGNQVLELATRDGLYLASVAPIGGKRAGVPVPLDWLAAAVVPERALLGPTHALERKSIVASASALAIAVGLALILAWNLVGMRKQVVASREEARTAEARARDLGSYRLVSRLGTGGMGEVWRAQHRLLAREAAIKLIRPEVLAHEQASSEIRERFRREAQTLASMKSRHTIALYDYGVTDAGVFYYVMELLDGLDLESLVARYGPQPAARVIDILAQACASLAEAHDAGLLHRDIKPPNLFICRAADELDITKLLDFGIVQTSDEPAATALPATDGDAPKLTRAGAALGTPGFMPPEQILDMQLDGRADLYALGCVAWWLLTGREVFSRDGGDAKLFNRHINDPLPSLAVLVKGWLPEELEATIASCLAKDSDQRPANARELAERLRAIPIPDEHAWTQGKIAAWWAAYQPPAPAPSVPSAEQQLLEPGRTDRTAAKTLLD